MVIKMTNQQKLIEKLNILLEKYRVLQKENEQLKQTLKMLKTDDNQLETIINEIDLLLEESKDNSKNIKIENELNYKQEIQEEITKTKVEVSAESVDNLDDMLDLFD